MSALLEAALWYHDLGMSVFPCKDKHTPHVKWKRYQTERATREQITAWWAEWPDAWIGIALGPISGAIRVDADGEVPWDQFGDMPETFEFVSPSGGRGWLLKYELWMAAIGSKFVLWKGKGHHQELRVQSTGAYTIVPPTPGYKSVREEPIAVAPDWLETRFKEEVVLDTARYMGHKESTEPDPDDLQGALKHIDADDYGMWVEVGMGLHALGDHHFDTWKEWSRKSSRYQDGDCEKKWGTFTRGLGGVGIATVFHLARQNGWKPKERGSGYRFQGIDSKTFGTTDYRMEWVIKRCLVLMQAGVIGGPKKSLKTSIAVDLVVSLGSGASFLGEFQVYKRRKTVLISGESGPAVLQETARRVCEAKGVTLEELDVVWDFKLPQASSQKDLRELARALKDLGAEVVVLDPVYLSLLKGSDANAANLMQMGPLVQDYCNACLDVGCTPILIAHAKKSIPKSPMELEDIAYTGLQEFARQWMLVNPRERFDPETGSHKLWFSVGGSAGHSGLWELDVQEGRISNSFDGRKWETGLTTVSKIAQEKEKARKQTVIRNMNRIKPLLVASPGMEISINKLKEETELTPAKLRDAIDALASQGWLERCDVKVEVGKGGIRDVEGVRIASGGLEEVRQAIAKQSE